MSLYPNAKQTSRRFRMIVVMVAVFMAVIDFHSARTQEGTVWIGEFFNNPYLIGKAAVTRQDGAIAFNWGTATPSPELNADNFSVRWASDPYFAAGTYRFYVLADDKIALRVDFPTQPQIDTFNNPAVGQLLSTDIVLEAGNHHVQVDYQEATGDAYV